MKRVGHGSERTNLIYSHPEMALQKAASDAIWQRTQAAKLEVERTKKGRPGKSLAFALICDAICDAESGGPAKSLKRW